MFLNHIECLVAAAVGLAVMLLKSRWKELAFPAIMLLTTAAVHAIHRPWWMYYYLHPAIPLAWFSGVALYEAIRLILQLLDKSQFNLSSPKLWKGVALCGLVATALVRSEERLEGNLQLIRQSPRINTDPVVSKMQEYAAQTHWAYVQYGENIYPFHARLLMPPELAMVTLKRYWSGQITEEEIVQTCARYQVEQLLLRPMQTSDAWKEFLTNYDVAYQDTNLVLYVAKRIKTR